MAGTEAAEEAGGEQLVVDAWQAVRLAWRAAPGWLLAHVGVTVVAGLLPVAAVWLLRDVVDHLVDRADGLPWSAPALVAVGIGTAVAPALTTYLHNQSGRVVGRFAQSELYLAMDRLTGLARAEDPAFRDRLQMAQTAGRSGPAQVIDALVAGTQSMITLIGLVTVLAVISPVAAGFALAGGIPALVAQLRLSRLQAGVFWRLTPIERREMFYMDLLTSLPAAKELRLLGLSGLFRRRMLAELTTADDERRKLDGRQLRVQFGLGLVAAVISGGGLLWAIDAARRGGLTIGDVSAFVPAMAALLSGVATAVMQVATLHQALLMFDHFRMLLETEPDLPVPATPVQLAALHEGIELRDVWFRYQPDAEWVLRGVDLTIPHGTTLAIVGLNGAGKSTLVKLLCRFYDPVRGEIRWDGTDLREVEIDALRNRIGAVFQDYMSYDLSAAENIGVGDVDSLDDEDRITAAGRRAGIDEALRALPGGYRTMLSRMFADPEAGTGTLLSGGQWQRLALARAFMREGRDLLILDEPSSGLDAESEYEIHHGLKEHRAGATSVLISHRLGAIRDADRIVVLSEGRIVEQGSHDTLLAAGGEYARLFSLQAEGYQATVLEDEVWS